MTSLSFPPPNPKRRGEEQTLALTPRGHIAAAGFPSNIVESLAGIVWVPVLRLPWYRDKRRDGAL